MTIRVGVASSTQLSADAGEDIIREGGNAVDAAIAAALVAITTEPGVCSVGGGGYLTIWPASGPPVTLDGNIEMPGRGLPAERLGGGAWDAVLEYGGGVTTKVGHGSVGTPGALAALELAAARYGSLPWAVLMAPVIEIARQGFPMSKASYTYLQYAHDSVYGWQDLSHAALHDKDGVLYPVGHILQVDQLADTLDHLARAGTTDFYRGDIARLIARDSEANAGVMTARDLDEYEVIAREPLTTRFGPWQLATNPAPAVGGATLSAMLTLLERQPLKRWDNAETARLASIQASVLRHRFEHLDLADDPAAAVASLMAQAGRGAIPTRGASASTVNTSAADRDGLACTITMSAGYGSGVIPPGTGIWMNNCLGEIELNRRGLIAGPAGTRLSSNMAPTTGRTRDGAILAIGSPGADRITSALVQTLLNHVQLDMPLDAAIAHPRLHVELLEDSERVAFETGVPIAEISLPTRELEPMSMFFGGVGAVRVSADGDFQIGADERRLGGQASG
ncbi:MAG: gamma-glutamyltransferase [Gammaproteobacteria bacterium]